MGAPMPGEIVDVKVSVGDKVEKGQSLCVVSAMKMEMTVSAPISGTVKKVHVAIKEKVRGDDLLFDIAE